MSERGVFAIDRGIFDHPKFHDEGREFSKLEAWVWLLSRAAWRQHTRTIGGRTIELERGQLAASIRYMAEAWGWSRSRVERFLVLLETETDGETEIETANETGITVITIRKYDEYQKVSLPRGTVIETQTETVSETPAGQQRDKEENIKSIKGREVEEPDHIAVAVSFFEAIGVDRDDPSWFGTYERARQWTAAGWSKDLILATARQVMAGRTGPPHINYFEKAIASAVARQNAPVPVAAALKGQKVEVRNAKPKSEWTTALDRLGDFARGEEGGSRGDGAAVQVLLPPRRSAG